MLNNYLLLALRNLLKNKTFSFINIFGLTLSMSVGLFVLLLFRDAYRYDQFHPDGDRVYRINTKAIRKDGSTQRYATTTFPLGPALSQGFSQVEEMTRFVNYLNDEIKSSGKVQSIHGLFAEPAFFRVFGFSM